MKNLENATVAIQKEGRLTKGSLEWLNINQGSDFPVSDEPFDETRELTDNFTGITVVGYSNGDTIKALACGQTDFGICGGDKYYEYEGGGVAIVDKLGFAKCSLVCARLEAPGPPIERIATSYPRLTGRFIDRIGGIRRNIRVDTFAGGIESIGRRNGYDTVVDVRQSGATLATNGYKITDNIADYEALLIGRIGKAIEPSIYDAIGQLGVFGLMEARLLSRKVSPTSSEASTLVSNENEAIKKLGSETSELVRSITRGDDDEIVNEAADLLYALIANLVQSGVELKMVESELGKRYGLRNRYKSYV